MEQSAAKVEWPELDDEAGHRLRETLTWDYGFIAATQREAKSSVTALRREAAAELDDEAEQVFPARRFAPTGRRDAHTKLSAADAGTAHHKFLQHVALESVGELATLKAEAERLERENVLSADERAVLDLENVAVFWDAAAGQKIRRHLADVRRELPFTAKFSPRELSEIIGTKSAAGLENEFIVVQGVADLVVLLPEEIWLVDFKTDAVMNSNFETKEHDYTRQLKLYASALAKIYARPVTNCWLHFLSAQRTVKI